MTRSPKVYAGTMYICNVFSAIVLVLAENILAQENTCPNRTKNQIEDAGNNGCVYYCRTSRYHPWGFGYFSEGDKCKIDATRNGTCSAGYCYLRSPTAPSKPPEEPSKVTTVKPSRGSKKKSKADKEDKERKEKKNNKEVPVVVPDRVVNETLCPNRTWDPTRYNEDTNGTCFNGYCHRTLPTAVSFPPPTVSKKATTTTTENMPENSLNTQPTTTTKGPTTTQKKEKKKKKEKKEKKEDDVKKKEEKKNEEEKKKKKKKKEKDEHRIVPQYW
ncbi:nucleolar protein 58-like isoform X2 [Dermacentor silvarum]|uniref:nucleolar protein 58-like isoform X2 n=1 Tax=Dermacentor silvarum TaxID=543639 RepID=UPI002101A4DF|nr:nucleolar protein 58-like isoform X2 [Dermacentor silvarum]